MQMEIKNDDSGARKGNRYNQVKLKKKSLYSLSLVTLLLGALAHLYFRPYDSFLLI